MNDQEFAGTEYVRQAAAHLDKLKADVDAFWIIYQDALDSIHDSRRLLELTEYLLTRKL